MKRPLLSLALLTLLAGSALAQSTVPTLMNFQGRLTKPDGTPASNGNYSVTFTLFDALTGGTSKWTETKTVTVRNGVYSVVLGSTTPLNETVFSADRWLEIKIGTAAALTPRQKVVSNAFAFKANIANTVPDGSLTAAKFAANAFNPLAWLLGGNSGTNPSSQFLGTTDNQPLVFRTNNAEKMRLDSAGNLGLGLSNPGAPFEIKFGTNADTFQLRFDGFTPGINMTGTDGVAGILRFRNRLEVWPNDGLTRVGGIDIRDTSGTANINLPGSGNAYFNQGNVGIGTTTPGSLLEVNGSFKSGGLTATTGNFTAALTGTTGTFSGALSSGALSATSGAFSAPVTAPSATIPTLTGDVTVGNELTAKVVTVLGGSDVAEPYDVAGVGNVRPLPGMVVAIDPRHIGQMRVAARAYDKTVAGILSGANGIAPGITLRQKGTVADGKLPVASLGRVWCWCDAEANGPIEAGDMLTTSNTPGHAMKVRDYNRANGAVIGKAMSSLKVGRGLVLVLVSLK